MSMKTKKVSSGMVHKLPEDLRKAIARVPAAKAVWDDITPLARNEWTCPHTCFVIASSHIMRTCFMYIYLKANRMEICTLALRITWGEDLPNTTTERIHQLNLEHHLRYDTMKRITTRSTLDIANRRSRKAAMLSRNWNAEYQQVFNNKTGVGVHWVISGKKAETRAIRIKKGISKLKSGMRRPCCWAGCSHRWKNAGDGPKSPTLAKKPQNDRLFAMSPFQGFLELLKKIYETI